MIRSLRKATLADIPILEQLIAESARALTSQDYTNAQIEAAIGTAWGVDTELIRDGTYFVVEDKDADLVGCGGWSRRKTLFGSDKQLGRESEVLDPSRNSARIRAFFVRPDWARRGIGRELLLKCEPEARRDGFRSASLVATLTGQRFYLSSGYVGEERVDYPLAGGTTITFVPMTKGKL
jgi:GNAT superfamily N-acetyltransferase